MANQRARHKKNVGGWVDEDLAAIVAEKALSADRSKSYIVEGLLRSALSAEGWEFDRVVREGRVRWAPRKRKGER